MDDEISQSDQYIYDAYSGLEIDGTDADVDECLEDDYNEDLAE